MTVSPATRERPDLPVSARRARGRGRLARARILEKLVLSVLVAAWLFPLAWVGVTSLKTRIQVAERVPALLFTPTVQNYVNLFVEFEFGRYLLSSTLIATGTTIGAIVLGSMAAYPLARLRFRVARFLGLWILSLYMMPAVAVAIPFYLFFFKLRLLDTHLAVILAHCSFLVPFGTWLLRGFLAELPRELDEAAALDGCSHLSTLTRILLPNAISGVAVTAIFVFVFSWNEFLFALMLTQRAAQTVPLALASMVLPQATRWGELAAGSVVTLGPLFLAVFLLQRHIVRGMTFGALK